MKKNHVFPIVLLLVVVLFTFIACEQKISAPDFSNGRGGYELPFLDILDTAKAIPSGLGTPSGMTVYSGLDVSVSVDSVCTQLEDILWSYKDSSWSSRSDMYDWCDDWEDDNPDYAADPDERCRWMYKIGYWIWQKLCHPYNHTWVS